MLDRTTAKLAGFNHNNLIIKLRVSQKENLKEKADEIFWHLSVSLDEKLLQVNARSKVEDFLLLLDALNYKDIYLTLSALQKLEKNYALNKLEQSNLLNESEKSASLQEIIQLIQNHLKNHSSLPQKTSKKSSFEIFKEKSENNLFFAKILLMESTYHKYLTNKDIVRILSNHPELIVIAFDEDLLSCLTSEELIEVCKHGENFNLFLNKPELAKNLSIIDCISLIKEKKLAEKIIASNLLIKNFASHSQTITTLLLEIIKNHPDLSQIIFAISELNTYIQDEKSLQTCVDACCNLPFYDIPIQVLNFLNDRQEKLIESEHPGQEYIKSYQLSHSDIESDRDKDKDEDNEADIKQAAIAAYYEKCKQKKEEKEESAERKKFNTYNPARQFSQPHHLNSTSLDVLLSRATKDINEDERTVTIICNNNKENEALINKIKEQHIPIQEEYPEVLVLSLRNYKKLQEQLEANRPSCSY